jgi:hypothetical protein
LTYKVELLIKFRRQKRKFLANDLKDRQMICTGTKNV